MFTTCPSCKAQNRDEARYCDQCGAPLTPDAVTQAAVSSPQPASAPAASRQAINWPALLILLAAIAVVGWLLLQPTGVGKALGGMTGTNATSANPHGEAAATPSMEEMMSGLTEAKQKIEKDPLDIDALTTLYKTYGMIGRQEKIRPYLDKALKELRAKQGALGAEKAQTTASDIASAAIAGQDLPGALEALKLLNEMAPEKLSVVSYIGDVYYDMGNADEAIAWYDRYLKKATPEAEGEAYWKVRVDRATMVLQSGQKQKKPELSKQALTDLEQITVAQPKMFSAWFNLGHAYEQTGEQAKAKATWQKCLPLAADAMEKWRAEAQLARLEGKEPPPPPANPHGEGAGAGGMGAEGMGGMGGMTNPHGAGGGSAEVPNPHGASGGDGAAGGVPNPHESGGAASGG